LRQEGFTNAASEDVSNQQLGRAQLDMARAIEGHIGRNLPQGGPVDLAQFQDARRALAKNYTVQSVLRGNEVDPQALARVQRADPELLDGGLKLAADFANGQGREVSALRTTVNAPSVVKDIAGAASLQQPISSTVQGVAGSLGRRLLTGGSAQGRAAAQTAFPGRLGEEFTPRPGLTPPPGNVGRVPPIQGEMPLPPGPPAGPGWTTSLGAGGPASGGRGGEISLADLLSHGVERGPPAGLSLAPEAPRPEGLTFRYSPELAAGGLETAPTPAGAPRERLGDLAAVMSQGVPEGTVARAAQPMRVPAVQYPGGQPARMLINNASGESAASQEAINRGTRDLAMVDPDGNETPLLRDVTQADRRAPKGNLIVDRSTGEIIDRGGMNQRQAESLRNRWASLIRLGDNFVPGRP